MLMQSKLEEMTKETVNRLKIGHDTLNKELEDTIQKKNNKIKKLKEKNENEIKNLKLEHHKEVKDVKKEYEEKNKFNRI